MSTASGAATIRTGSVWAAPKRAGRCTKKGWEIYFSDRKNKIGLMQFASESEACMRMKEEVLKLMEQVYGLSWRNFA